MLFLDFIVNGIEVGVVYSEVRKSLRQTAKYQRVGVQLSPECNCKEYNGLICTRVITLE